MNNKKTILIIVTILLVSCIVFCFINLFHNKRVFNIDKTNKMLLEKYDNLDLRVFDQFEANYYFGFDTFDIDNSLFMSNFIEKENTIFDPDDLVLIINTETPEEYYDELNGLINSNESYFTEEEKIIKYHNAILKKTKQYIYLIISSDAKQIEEDILKCLD